MTRPAPFDLAGRVAGLDWPRIARDLDAVGCAGAGPLLTPDECAALRELYGQ